MRIGEWILRDSQDQVAHSNDLSNSLSLTEQLCDDFYGLGKLTWSWESSGTAIEVDQDSVVVFIQGDWRGYVRLSFSSEWILSGIGLEIVNQVASQLVTNLDEINSTLSWVSPPQVRPSKILASELDSLGLRVNMKVRLGQVEFFGQMSLQQVNVKTN